MKRFLSLLFAGLILATVPVAADTPPELVETIPLHDLNLNSKNYILMDAEDGSILSAENPITPVHPASLTKVLTLITVLEMLADQDLHKTVVVTPDVFETLDPEASIAGLEVGVSYSLQDLLYALKLASGADAARVLSLYLTDSLEGLAQNMNDTAQRIGLMSTQVVNTTGLDDPHHLSTVYDLAKLIRYSLNNPTFKTIYTAKDYTIIGSNQKELEIQDMVLEDAGKQKFTQILGAKSGYTDAAERALSTYASDGKHSLIFVSTNAPYEYMHNYALDDAMSVYRYVFDNYHKVPVALENQDVGVLNIENRKNYPVKLQAPIQTYFPRNQEIEAITFNLTPEQNLIAPLSIDHKLGTLTLNIEGRPFYQQDLFSITTIQKHWFLRFLDFMPTLLLILVITSFSLIMFVMILRYRNRQKMMAYAQSQRRRRRWK